MGEEKSAINLSDAEADDVLKKFVLQLHETADNLEFCSEFDDIMEEAFGDPSVRRPLDNGTAYGRADLEFRLTGNPPTEALHALLKGFGFPAEALPSGSPNWTFTIPASYELSAPASRLDFEDEEVYWEDVLYEKYPHLKDIYREISALDYENLRFESKRGEYEGPDLDEFCIDGDKSLRGVARLMAVVGKVQEVARERGRLQELWEILEALGVSFLVEKTPPVATATIVLDQLVPPPPTEVEGFEYVNKPEDSHLARTISIRWVIESTPGARTMACGCPYVEDEVGRKMADITPRLEGPGVTARLSKTGTYITCSTGNTHYYG